MLIRPKALPIDPKAPFALDELGREDSAKTLTQLLNRVDTPFVLALDAKWGNGKTTFLRMWKHHLASQGIRTFEFNAWESDYATDPLISFIGEMGASLKSGKHDGDTPSPQVKKAWTYVSQLGTTLAKRAIPATVKLATYGALDLEKITEDVWAKVAEDFIKDQIVNYEKDKSTVKDFKKRLESFVKELNRGGNQGTRPVVFLIDELDRCRPTYTIALLERIKHFFDVEGLAFVFSIDKEQLGHSIRAVYGAGIDVDGYLRRFIDLEYKLPGVAAEGFVTSLANRYQIGTILERIGASSGGNDYKTSFELLDKLARILGLTLRQHEHAFARLSVALLTWPVSNVKPDLNFLVILILLNAKSEEFYHGLWNSTHSFQDLLNFIRSAPGGQDFLNEDTGARVELYCLAWRKGAKDPTATTQLNEYKDMLDPNSLKNKLPAEILNRASEILQWIERIAARIHPLRFYYQAIGISGQFRELPENYSPAEAPHM
jgi:hypothetical protein